MKIKMNDEQKIKEEALSDIGKLKNMFLDYHRQYIQRNIRYRLLNLVEENRGKIQEFRKIWHFPNKNIETGFKTGKESRKWWRTLPAEVTKRRRTICHFEEEYIIHVKNFQDVFISPSPIKFGKRKKVLDGRSLKYLFIYEIEELMVDCKIDPFWYYPFEHYVLYNEVNLNFLFGPGFSISIKETKGSGNKTLSQYVGILISANTRLRDISRFVFPIIKYYQTQLQGYKDDPDLISKDDEKEYKLGPKYIPKQTTDTWLVSSGYVRLHERSDLHKAKSDFKVKTP